MVEDLIDLYFYIKNSTHINELYGWDYVDGNGMHIISLITPTHDTWEFKLELGERYLPQYQLFFLSPTKIVIKKAHTSTVLINGIIDETASDVLMENISTEEIHIMNSIYLEMYKLKNRSCN